MDLICKRTFAIKLADRSSGRCLTLSLQLTNSDSQTSGYLTRAVAVKSVTNTSTVSRAAWLNDNTAVLVPSKLPIVGYEASTIGINVQCKSVTTECVSCSSYQPDTIIDCDGSKAGPALDCTGSTKINAIDLVDLLNYGEGPTLLSALNGSAIRFQAERK